ncbi:protein of unknown function [Taphrina deformans PYCC 5710]|uniref:Mitochondrial outer membrane protein OM14 C-terminal domain-containing protein n=1 Tax=Taphrina deformans (strain PYCC 5710 / ATCC 11124 / CBS 356.35 / IMI 108563 / JCM 9778 / NBRC 8474) TaxID=1097556 RepID=R4XEQ1_TAPDE|nr:protein of unknown function [Taphrina deformans PYCC 5710]|eukprot:CCG84256.1 protein of unknown function [Taphrina deformans PYCC 5710]
MSSYADVASHGPPQSDKDKQANPVPQLDDHTAVETKDVTSDDHSINVVPSDFKDREVKTETQAAQHRKDDTAREVEEQGRRAARKAKEVGRKTENVLLSVGKDGRTYNVIDSILVVTLGVVGYRRYRDGQLDLQTVSTGVAGLVLFAGVQGYVQRWFSKQ